MAYVILQVPGDGEVISSSFLTRIRDNQEVLFNRPFLGDHFQRFTSSGTWTKPAGVTWVYAQVIGGGASGWEQDSAQERHGGAPGQISDFLIRASTLGSSVSVTVGSGGLRHNTGRPGGASSFGPYGAKGGTWLAFANLTDVYYLGPPGYGGASHSNADQAAGFPGLGQSAYTGRGATGANSTTGTGAGGGGNTGSGARAGDGGTPGGGGGSGTGSSARAGNGGRGEVRLWGW